MDNVLYMVAKWLYGTIVGLCRLGWVCKGEKRTAPPCRAFFDRLRHDGADLGGDIARKGYNQ